MRNDASKNILNLIQLLLDGNDYGLDEICEKLSISRRNFYYLAGFLRENGFDVFKSENKSYHIDRRSPWIAKIAESMRLTDDELTTLRSLLIMVGNGNGPINSLRQKFEAAYNITKVDSVPEMRRQNMILRKLTNAIQHKFTVRLIDYSSPHSHTVKDRIVEPFLMMNSNRDVRCYELTTSMNKTFKVARIADVEVLTDRDLFSDQISDAEAAKKLGVEDPKLIGLRNVMPLFYTATEKYLANDKTVKDYMVPKPATVFRKTSLSEVARIMIVNDFGQVPVHGTKDELVGMIYDVDVLRAIIGAVE